MLRKGVGPSLSARDWHSKRGARARARRGLHLNANARIQRRWERDIPGFIRAADANWPALGG